MSGVVADKYELLRRLGKGGMAEVFLARQRGMDGFEKLVVVKRILPQLAGDEEFVTMFLDEARTAADLRHPNVVNIFEIGEDAGTYFMAMEFLHGQDIRRIQRKSVKMEMDLPLEHALQIAIDAAAGLHHAHTKTDLSGRQMEIVHRDVSPQNILCTFDGATKIVDFGIAKAASQTAETQSGIVKGKYTYMSPEQALGDEVDGRTDQFALGIVLWELLTMRRLFKRETDIATLTAITSGEVPPPGEFVSVPEELDRIVLKALALDREDRFDTCEDLALAIEDLLAAERLPHSPARVGGFLKRLFADELDEEKRLGIGRLDGESISMAPPPTAVGRRSARAVATDAAEPLDKGAPTASQLDDTRVEGPSVFSDDPSGEGAAAAVRGGGADEHPPAGGGEQDTGPTATGQPLPLRTATAELVDSANIGRQIAVDAAERKTTARVLLSGMAAVGCLALIAALVMWVVNRPVHGEIVVRTIPKGATVTVNDVEHPERTPLIFRDAVVGQRYTVRVSLNGHLKKMRSVTLANEGQKLELDFNLTPLKEP